MKVYTVIFSFLTIITSECAFHGASGHEEPFYDTLIKSFVKEEIETEFGSYSFLDGILKRYLQTIVSNVKYVEPFRIPDLPTQKINDKHVQVNITLTNVHENKGSSLVINSIKGNTFAMTEKFDVTLPTLELYGNYAINGKVLTNDVVGEGLFHISTTNLHIWGSAQAHIVDDSVQLESLTIDYTLESVTANATGLKVHDVPEVIVKDLLSEVLLVYFKDNEKLVCATISKAVIMQVNKQLSGMTFSQFVKWLRHAKPSS